MRYAAIFISDCIIPQIYNLQYERCCHRRVLGQTMSLSLQLQFAQTADSSEETRRAEIQEKLRTLDRRDWWLWTTAVIVMLLLTFAVFSMSFPGLVKVDDPFFQASLNRAVRGLIGLVLIFNAYTIYQQITVKRLRRDFSKKIEEMRILQARAEQFERLALVDSLTGLSNRRVAEGRLAAEADRSKRYGHPLTVISFDLDKQHCCRKTLSYFSRYGKVEGEVEHTHTGELRVIN